MAQKQSAAFGALIARMLAETGCSHMEAAAATGYAVSPTYFSVMRSGHIPSFAMVKAIAESDRFYGYAHDLYLLSGYRTSDPDHQTLNALKEAAEIMGVPLSEVARALAEEKIQQHKMENP